MSLFSVAHFGGQIPQAENICGGKQ